MKILQLHSDNLDEIVFEHRNKEYGAYELRKSHDARVVKSFFAAICSLTFLIGTPVLIHHLLSEKKTVIDDSPFLTTPVDLSQNFKVEEQKATKPVHSDPPRTSSADVPLKVIKDSLITEDKKDSLPNSTNTNLLAAKVPGDSTSNDKKGSLPDTSAYSGAPLATIASTAPFNLASVDKAPEFPGGENAMRNFLENNIHFSQIALERKINGKVFVSFIINTKGRIEAIKILNSIGYGLDEEVVRVVTMMPVWKPGYFQGNAVSTIMNLPVSFNIIQ